MSLTPSQQQGKSSVVNSTLTYAEKKDFSTAVASSWGDAYDADHWNALMSASAQHATSQKLAKGYELDLIEAAASLEKYDKMLLLVRHGDVMFKKNGQIVADPQLSGQGVGQVLNLSRRTATYCNEETGLVPELVVTSPLTRAMQTALFIFPEHSPEASLRPIPWICHGGLVERPSLVHDVPAPKEELGRVFRGVDYSLYDSHEKSSKGDNIVESKLDLLDRTDDFLQWIKEREERVIVVSSHSTWLQSLCGCTLDYAPEESGHEMFKTGEMRAVGVNFV